MDRMAPGTETTVADLRRNASAGPMPAAQSSINDYWYY
jgi:hypothetical protein